MPDYASFRVGSVTYPLPVATPGTLLQACDPAVYWALQFYEAVLEHHIAAPLVAEALVCGAPIAEAVAARISYDPGQALFSRPENRFPLLAVYRAATRYFDRTVTWSGEESEWGIAYVLPPLAPAQATRLLPILRAVAQTVQQCTERGFDPAYSSGLAVWDDTHGGIDRIAITEGSYGQYDDSRGLPIHAWIGKAIVRERTRPIVGGLMPFAGADGAVSVTDDTAVELDVVTVATNITPPAAG